MDGKCRPIKFPLNSENEKMRVLRNLSNLKGKQDYKGMSITYVTPAERTAERTEFKLWQEKARVKNSEEPTASNIYRVRGGSKNGFFSQEVLHERTATTITIS